MRHAHGSHGSKRFTVHGIVPPHLLRHLARRVEKDVRELAECAMHTLLVTERLRGERAALGRLASLAAPTPGEERRTLYDAGHGELLPGRLVRSEGQAPSGDAETDEAYDAAGATYALYEQVFARNSVDGRGMRLDGSVHFSHRYDNAFWNGVQMVYGDGDGVLFERFTKAVDVIGHELTHGVTQYEAGLLYVGQSGALNESMSDVFGSLVKQYAAQQTAAEADWLIGQGLFKPIVHGVALRSMSAPGTAYDDPLLGHDPQPAHMRDYVHTWQDNGGVHINSGIPNHAFYLTAMALGGHAWERAGAIWYGALCDRLKPTADFTAAADATIAEANERFGADAVSAVREAWLQVGVTPSAAATRARRRAAHARRVSVA